MLVLRVVYLLVLVLEKPLGRGVGGAGELTAPLRGAVGGVWLLLVAVFASILIVCLLGELTALIRGLRAGRCLLEVQVHAIGADVKDLLRIHLLLLVQRYLVVELLQQLVWVRKHLILLEVSLCTVLVLIVFLFEACVDHRLVLGQGGQSVVVVVAIEL